MTEKTTNLWRATASPVLQIPALAGETRTDVLVIGGGIMGATAALTLAESGASVALLEARRIGEEASSRAGGFVVPHFTFAGPSEAIAALGTTGERLVDAVGHSATKTFDLIRKHAISCDAKQGGWYQPAIGASAFNSIRMVAEDWSALGFPARILDGAETHERTGVAGYTGSWMVPTGGTLHPLNYTIGLALAAEKAGAKLYEHSPATNIQKTGDGFRVDTPQGAVLAKRIIICTNAQSRGLIPAFEKSIVRMKVWQTATAPVPEHARRHLFKNGESLSDTRGNLFTYRFDRDWRLITGMVTAFGISADHAARSMAKRLQAQLTLPEIPAIDYIWSGKASVTRSRMPEITLGKDGMIAVTACNGRGIALSTVLGEAIARAVIRDRFDDLPAPVVTAEGGLDIALQQWLAPFYPYYSLVTDWFRKQR